MKKSPSKTDESASERIDARIAELGDWRGEMLARLRSLIREAVCEHLIDERGSGTEPARPRTGTGWCVSDHRSFNAAPPSPPRGRRGP